MELTQTLNQKETAQLLSDFFDEITKSESEISKRFRHIQIKHIYESTGVKLDKPLFMDIHEGSFTTNALLKKYPLSTNQVMFIVALYNTKDYWSGTDKVNHCITRVYNTGKVYTDGMRSSYRRQENYLSPKLFNIPYTLDEFNSLRKRAFKTLVIVANRNNMIMKENRTDRDIYDSRVLSDLSYNPAPARVQIVDDIGSYYVVALTGRKAPYLHTTRIYKHWSNDEYPLDHSGYVVGYFRNNLDSRLNLYKKRLELKKVATTDYSSYLQKIYDETVVLKNLLASTLINTTDTELVHNMSQLLSSVSRAFSDYDDIKKRLNNTITYYNGNKSDTYPYTFSSDRDVMRYIENCEDRLSTIRKELFDYLQQADI
jgi:hypothetical protein